MPIHLYICRMVVFKNEGKPYVCGEQPYRKYSLCIHNVEMYTKIMRNCASSSVASGLLASLEQRGEVTLGRPCLNLTKIYVWIYKMDYQSNPHHGGLTVRFPNGRHSPGMWMILDIELLWMK